MRDNRRIVIIGSHGVGKTTLTLALVKKLTSQNIQSTLFTNVAIKVVEKGLPIGKQCNIDSYLAFMNEHIHNWYIPQSHITIFDRSIYDLFAYIRVNKNGSFELHRLTYQLCNLFLIEKPYIYYIPIEIPLVSAANRDTDPEFQKSVDIELLKILQELKIKYTITSGKIEERVQKILNVIKPINT